MSIEKIKKKRKKVIEKVLTVFRLEVIVRLVGNEIAPQK